MKLLLMIKNFINVVIRNSEYFELIFSFAIYKGKKYVQLCLNYKILFLSDNHIN